MARAPLGSPHTNFKLEAGRAFFVIWLDFCTSIELSVQPVTVSRRERHVRTKVTVPDLDENKGAEFAGVGEGPGGAAVARARAY